MIYHACAQGLGDPHESPCSIPNSKLTCINSRQEGSGLFRDDQTTSGDAACPSYPPCINARENACHNFLLHVPSLRKPLVTRGESRFLMHAQDASVQNLIAERLPTQMATVIVWQPPACAASFGAPSHGKPSKARDDVKALSRTRSACCDRASKSRNADRRSRCARVRTRHARLSACAFVALQVAPRGCQARAEHLETGVDPPAQRAVAHEQAGACAVLRSIRRTVQGHHSSRSAA